MRLYNRNGILYIDINGKRTSSKLQDTPTNRKLLENQYKNTEFYKKFNVKTKGKTVLEFCREVLEEKEKKLQPTTIRSYYSLFESRIVPFFDKKYPHEITPAKIKDWYYTFKDRTTLNTCVTGILIPAFENAIIEGYIQTTPFIVKFPTLKSDYEMKPFTLQEIDLILTYKENPEEMLKEIVEKIFSEDALIEADYYYLQPCDTGNLMRNSEITTICIEYIKRHPKWRLSLQTHKLIGFK